MQFEPEDQGGSRIRLRYVISAGGTRFLSARGVLDRCSGHSGGGEPH